MKIKSTPLRTVGLLLLGLIFPTYALAASGPSITTPPQSQSVVVGSNAVFNVVGSGQTPLFYQWSFNGTNLTDNARINGSTNVTLTVSNVVAGDAGNYQVTVSNSHGSVTSSNATLTVLVPAVITSQPTNTVAFIGGKTVFSVTDFGTLPRFERWQKNGTNLANDVRINGASTPVLTISNIQMGDVGSYQLVVSNAYGAAASAAASLLVVPVVAWGDNTYGQTNVPATLTNAVAVAAGSGFDIALKSDGSVVAWGNNRAGQTNVPTGLSGVIAIAAGDSHSLALKSNGTVVAWGDDSLGQTNVPTGLSNVVAIAAGRSGSSLALRGDGTVVGWGNNDAGQVWIPAGLSNVVAIAEGLRHGLALKDDGNLIGWGGSGVGETSLPAGVSNVVAIAAGDEFSLALQSDGTVVSWGLNNLGQTNVPSGLSDVMAIAAGDIHSLALQHDGTVVAWGFDTSAGETNVPAGLSDVVAIAAGQYESLALVENPTTPTLPTIWRQPPSRTCIAGQETLLLSDVIGSLPLKFQWYFNGVPLPAETNKWLVLSSLQPAEVGNYQFIAANNYGAVTSQVVTITESPAVTGQPASQAAVQSSNAVFTAFAVGSLPLRYQWYFSDAPLVDGGRISGSTTTNLNIANVQADDAGSYLLVVTNNYGATTSAVATLTVLLPPTIATPPASQAVAVGLTATFQVTVSGTGSFGYQWQENGTNLSNNGHYSGATDYPTGPSEIFQIYNVQIGDSGNYQVIVTNAYGQTISSNVALSVGYPPLGNIEPLTESVPLNGTATFSVFVPGGSGPFTCQWQKNGVIIPNDDRVSSTNDPLVISPVLASDAGSYSVIVSNAYGTLDVGWNYNSPGVLTVMLPPSITAQPQSQSVVAGTNAIFSVSATSASGSISYQWFFDGTNIPGAQAASVALTNVQATNAGDYSVVLSNYGGAATSAVAKLTVQPSAPWFITPLTSQEVPIGQTVVFDSTARGSDPLSFQWTFNGTNLSGAASGTLNLSNAQTNNSGAYQVVVTNNYGSATSAVAVLIVQNPVQIVGQPASQAVLLGSNASFTVTATGTALNYQWYFNGTPLTDGDRVSGSATPVLSMANVQSADAGSYVVVITNLLSSATSFTATLTPQFTLAPSVRYVSLTSTNPVSPYLDWSTAATNIQDAIDAAVTDDSVIVSNGTYNTGGRVVYTTTINRVVINKAVTVQSVNGPAATTIVGFYNPVGAHPTGRCVYLASNACLSGFTLLTGGTSSSGDVILEQSGGGVWCESLGSVVSNCVFSGDYASRFGGGAFGGTLINCILTNNSANYGGGAASNILIHCIVAGNGGESPSGYQGAGYGGGAFDSTLSNCVLAANSGVNGGGAFGGILFNCVLTNNSGSYGGGTASNILCNCILANNLARGGGSGAYNSILYNCTVASNSYAQGGSGIYGGAATNSIIYYNALGNDVFNSKSLAYCCTPSSGTLPGCITNPPLFVNFVGGDFHLLSNSPCINSGNNAYVTVTNDLDGNPRIVGGMVDIGAYEYQSPTSVISYAWLQQYGLPTDGSVDYTNLDGTGFNVYQDWIAGLNPTNAASVLQAYLAVYSPGITILWPSVSNRNYYVQRSTNLQSQPFITIQSNIPGHTGTSSYTDVTATNGGPYFYRVGVQ
jgi:alpha-tubulin suppressor-like RCC1 family protein